MKRSLSQSAIVITLLSAISSIMALLVDAVTAAHFGAGGKMDAYLTASVIPNILAMTVPTTLSIVFIPVFHKVAGNRGEPEAWKIAGKLFNALGLVLAALAVASLPFAETIIRVTAPGFAPELIEISARIFRWMIIGSVFIGLNAILTSFYNATYRFGLPAFMPVVRNCILLLGIVLLAGYFDIAILAYASFFAGVVQCVLLMPLLLKDGRYCRTLSLDDPEIRDALRLSLILLAGNIAYSAHGVIDRYMGSYLAEGSISYLGYANKMGMFFSNLISVGISTVAFSRFSQQAAGGDRKALAEEIVRVMSVITLLLVPALAALLVLREPILAIVFKRSAFTQEAVTNTGYALAGYAGFLIVMGIGRPVTLAIFSLRETMITVIVNVISLAVYVPVIYLFCVVLGMGYVGIALATSLINCFNCAWYVLFLKRKLQFLDLAGYGRYAARILFLSLTVAFLCAASHTAIKLFFAGMTADILAILAGFAAWAMVNGYLFLKKDVLLLTVYKNMKSRLTVI